jgi:quinol monooxygenase YgiN
MFVRVSRARFHPGKIEEAMRLLQGNLPALRQTPGFISALWLHDPETQRAIQSVTFETEAQIEAASATPLARQAAGQVQPLMAEQAPPETYEVLLRERGPAFGQGAAVAAVLWPQPRPGVQDEALAQFRQTVLQLLLQQPGLVGVGVNVNRQANKVMAVSLWASEEDEQAALARFQEAQGTARPMQRFEAGPPTRETYRVLHWEQPRGGSQGATR